MGDRDEPGWVGPTAWGLFLGGFFVMAVSSGVVGVAMFGALMSLAGLVMLVATGRVFPKR